MRRKMIAAIKKSLSSLSSRLLVTNLLLIAAPLTIIGLFSYRIYSADLERSTELYSNQILGKLQEQVEDQFTQLDNNLTTLWIQNDLQKLIKLPADEWKEHPSQVYNLSRYISTVFGWREGNKGLFVITHEGIVHQEMAPAPFPKADRAAIAAYLEENRDRRRTWISGPHPQRDNETDMVFSINRPLLNIPNYDWTGVIRYDMDAQVLFRLFQSTKFGTSGYFTALDRSGETIYRPAGDRLVNTSDIRFPDGFEEMKEGSFTTRIRGVKYVVSFVTLSVADWKLIGIVPWSEIVEGAHTVRTSLIFVGGMTMLLGSLLILRLNRFLLMPLHQLNRAIRKLGGGDFNGQIPIPPIRELRSVAEQYNSSVEQLRTLTEELYVSKLRQQDTELRRQEAELRMREAEFSQLQAQINPHFLYNTLSTIDSMAEAEMVQPIRQAVSKLSHLFRYAVATDKPRVRLEEELAHVRSFVTLQQFRYENRIRVLFEVEDEVRQTLMHRLTLQPLVENAYFHGLESRIEGGVIRIAARADGTMLRIEVSDDGVGMSPEKLESLRQFVACNGTADAAQRMSGIRNVIRRVYLSYGDRSRVEIASSEQNGTRITLLFPLELPGQTA